MPRIVTNLWFDGNALEAAEHYCSIFPNSTVGTVTHYTASGGEREGQVLTVDFVLDGTPFTAINGGPQFQFDEAISLLVECADQAEIDYYWDAFTKEGEESMCGWCKDRYGLSWQIVPAGWEQFHLDPDTAKVDRMVSVMFQMRKLDIAALEAAFDGG
jgi:predicted 3-demethylubiquinone-9 3-methyltransferase (glyoxalase superfamily)